MADRWGLHVLHAASLEAETMGGTQRTVGMGGTQRTVALRRVLLDELRARLAYPPP